MAKARIFDTIPFSDSGENAQNSEPSLAVDPLDPTQIIVGAFGVSPNPYFKSTTGGTAWFDDGSLFHNDKSLAWKTDGSGAITATLVNGTTGINTYFEPTGGSSFGAPINQFAPGHVVDQPWVRTGPSNHVYVGFNDFNSVASMLVSVNGGVNYTQITLDRVGAGIQDNPSIREAVNGSTVYAIFERWNTVVENDANGARFTSQVVVERSDNGGASFTALGAGGNGVIAGTPTGVFANTTNTPLTLGQERVPGSDLAIAVDPNNAAHVITVWLDAPGANGAGIMQLHLAESFNLGNSWAEKFVTSAATRSDQAAVSISSTGAIGLLYNNYDPATNKLSQHIVTTTNDFVTSTDQTLATESNATPPITFHPYQGDFFDLTSVGNTFYGIFSASNADNGTDAQFSSGVTFGRNFTGNSGTASFHLTDLNGNQVASSIDPYFFTYQLGDSFGKMFLHTDAGQNAYWLMNESVRVGTGANLQSTDPSWHVKALVDQDNKGPDFSDLVWQNDNGLVAIWQLQGTTPVQQHNLQQVDPTWHVKAAADFDGNTVADVLLQNDNGLLAIWELQNTATSGPQFLPNGQFNIGQNPGPTWHAVAAGDFNGDGRAGILFFNDDQLHAAIWEMQPGGPAIGPNGVFTEQVNLPSTGSTTWKPVAVADFNGAGKDDILWRNDNGAVAIWEMTGTADGKSIAVKANGQFNITQSVDPSWHVVAARDFNPNDNKAGILWQNDNGAIALWENFTEGPPGSGQATFTTQLNITPQPNPPGHLDWHIV